LPPILGENGLANFLTPIKPIAWFYEFGMFLANDSVGMVRNKCSCFFI